MNSPQISHLSINNCISISAQVAADYSSYSLQYLRRMLLFQALDRFESWSNMADDTDMFEA